MVHKNWPRPFQYFRDVRTFLLTISVVVTVGIAVIYLFRYHAVNELLIQTVRHEAESFAQLIVLTRHWNAEYGGVYVEKRPGVTSNPYLKELGIDPDIRTADGRILTMRNPAIMTREISQLARRDNMAEFHMVSLKSLNPENRPDDFEKRSLERFERGERDIWQIERSGEKPIFRYILPLVTEESCLPCHGKQGYRIGDIRGGVSVIIPAAGLMSRMSTNRNNIIIDAVITIGVLLAILYLFAWKLVVRLEDVQERLKHLAVTDELTELKNRRYIMEQVEREYQRAVRTGTPLSLVLIDIDHFKKVNDTFGHAFGDAVLKAVARDMRESLRTYDLLGRIGGEEFLIASPGSTLEEAAALAERIKEKIREKTIANKDHSISVTVSAGVTSLSGQDMQADSMLARVDDALYQAKQGGRDRVVTA
ncbi:MAG: diguanylate cyclase [Nitrospirae bacterium]|nr:diguanylate cyclase [Nitrospirota bacterium]NTW66259.1 diguanylate cyclase [Nitrospirota bacterium]